MIVFWPITVKKGQQKMHDIMFHNIDFCLGEPLETMYTEKWD